MRNSRKTFVNHVRQKEIIRDSLKERAYVEGNIPITGRSLNNYMMNLFPDIEKIEEYYKDKDYLDVACGINHEYSESLLRKIKNKKKKHGLDIHGGDKKIEDVRYYRGSIYKTPFKDKTYDCITVNNFMYFWESKVEKLLIIFKELHRILKKDGEIRIFPIYYGNYHLENIELHEYLNKNFMIRCLFPKNDYSKESPIYIEANEIKETDKSNGVNEYRINRKLMSQVLILKKI